MNGSAGSSCKPQAQAIKILEIPQHLNQLQIYKNRILEVLDLAGDRKVIIISINGRMRTGKSFMLNQFEKYLKFSREFPQDWISQPFEASFKCSNAAERVTSGIDIISVPYFIPLGDEEVAVYLMDTQGLFDPQTKMLDNTLIFVFSLLISSVTIFNDKVSSEDMFQFLQVFLDYAKIAASDNGQDEEDSSYKFHSLLLLLRDWQADEDYKYGFYSSTQKPPGQGPNLKDKFFSPTQNFSADASKLRLDILSSFEEISVFASPPPNRNPKILDLNPPKVTEWDPTFLQNTKALTSLILSPASLSKSIKQIGKIPQTGRTLKEFVNLWTDLLQSPDGFPEFSTILGATIKLHYSNIIQNLMDQYQTQMEEFLTQINPTGVPTSTLSEEHSRIKELLLGQFAQCKSIGGSQVKNNYKENLKVQIDTELNTFRTINTAKVKAEEERLKAEEQKKKKEKANKEAISQAKNRLEVAQTELTQARNRRKAIEDNKSSFNKTEVTTTEDKSKLVGITIASDTKTVTRVIGDDGAYENALAQARTDINRREEQLKEAEDNLKEVMEKINRMEISRSQDEE